VESVTVGIEKINAYTGKTFIDARELFESRGLDLGRFDNLMMLEKSIGCPWEDAVTFGVNAAKPIIDSLSKEDRDSIELLITSSESGLDFGKSLSTYIHDYLDLSRQCRLFELKQACYGGTAGLQMAVAHITSGLAPGSKALIVCTDVARATTRHTYAEPSQAVTSVAMLISSNPEVLEVDAGAYGVYGFEVMDTCRPQAEIETGDPDLSLLSYLDCLSGAYQNYVDKVDGVDFESTFDFVVYHTPFGGMVKGAHRKIMRDLVGSANELIEADFNNRVANSLIYGSKVGNAYSASIFLALMSLIDNSVLNGSQRIGLFSYGSGCCSEFYSGVVKSGAKNATGDTERQLRNRKKLSIDEYDRLTDANEEMVFGLKDMTISVDGFDDLYKHKFENENLLVLDHIHNYHRVYRWS